MGRGCCWGWVPTVSPSNTVWPGLRPTSLPSGSLVHPTVWSQFWAIFNIIWGSCTDPLLPMRVKFGVLEHTQGLHLQAKFHLNVFIVSACGGQKPQFGQILTFWGAPVPTPFYRRGPNLVCYSRPAVYVYLSISSRSVFSVVLWRRNTPIFAVFTARAMLALQALY